MSSQIALLVLGAALAGFVQGVSGFAFGMVAMSVWAWGIEPQVASVLAVGGGLAGQVLSAFTVRRGLSLPTLMPYLLGAVVGIPLGVMVLPHLDAKMFRLALGLTLLVCCPLMMASARLPKITGGGRLADGLAGAAGGVMGGIGGFTGVVPSLWSTLRGYDKDLQRAVVQNFNLAALATTMAAYIATGAVTTQTLPLLAAVIPALILPSMLGARLYRGLSPLAFRRVVLALLSCAGAVMVLGSLGSVLRPG